MTGLAALAALALTTAQATGVSTPPPPQPPPAEVTVKGARLPPPGSPELGRRAEDVQGVLLAPRGQLTARWGGPYCPRVFGLDPGQADRAAARMREDAKAAGAWVGEDGCTRNVTVLVTPDPDGEVERLLKRGLGRFSDAMWPRQIRAALLNGRPVRWLGAREKLSADGLPPVPWTFRFRAGHIVSSERYDLTAQLVMVDARRVDGLGLSALADYLAFVSLAEVRPDPPAPHPATILDLFDDPQAGRTRAAGLTTWDQGLLRGLYALDPESNPGMQRFGVAETLAKRGAPVTPARP